MQLKLERSGKGALPVYVYAKHKRDIQLSDFQKKKTISVV